MGYSNFSLKGIQEYPPVRPIFEIGAFFYPGAVGPAFSDRRRLKPRIKVILARQTFGFREKGGIIS